MRKSHVVYVQDDHKLRIFTMWSIVHRLPHQGFKPGYVQSNDISSGLTRCRNTNTFITRLSVRYARYNALQSKFFRIITCDVYTNKRLAGTGRARHSSYIFHRPGTRAYKLERISSCTMNNSQLCNAKKFY